MQWIRLYEAVWLTSQEECSRYSSSDWFRNGHSPVAGNQIRRRVPLQSLGTVLAAPKKIHETHGLLILKSQRTCICNIILNKSMHESSVIAEYLVNVKKFNWISIYQH